MTDQNVDGRQVGVAQTPSAGPVLSAAWYEFLKWFTLIFLPAFSALYFGLAAIWVELPAAEQVVGTSAILATFLGLILGRSSQNFNKQGADGAIYAQVDGDQVILSRLALPNITPEELATKSSITIRVNPNTGASQ